jgi:hypothetical protein
MGDKVSEDVSISDEMNIPYILRIINDKTRTDKLNIDDTMRTKYQISVFDTQKDYDIYHDNEVNTAFNPYNQMEIDDPDVEQLWEFAQLLIDDDLDEHKYMYEDMSYQEFANITKCKIVVRVNINDITHYNPKIYDSSEKNKNVIMIIPPLINKYDTSDEIMSQPSCICNFVHVNGLWHINRRPIIRNDNKVFKD